MDAIAFALGRRLTLIRGPPGTGKTRTAALLVASTLRLRGWQPSEAEIEAEIEAQIEAEAEAEGGGESEGEDSPAAAEVLFARLQAISPGVQREDYYDAHLCRWDLEGLESDLMLADRVAGGAAAAASASAALGAHATDVIDGRGSVASKGESGSEVGGGGESEGEGESEGAVAEGPLPPPRVLAVAHSNGAADVLLKALLRLGVPAVRAGRPAAVSPSVRRRTAVALAEQHPEVTPSPPRTHPSPPRTPPHLPAHTPTCPYSPFTSPYTPLHLAELHPEVSHLQVVALRASAQNASLSPRLRAAASVQVRGVCDEVRRVITRVAPVVVSSCVGAAQLAEEGVTFSLVVLDEGSQATFSLRSGPYPQPSTLNPNPDPDH